MSVETDQMEAEARVKSPESSEAPVSTEITHEMALKVAEAMQNGTSTLDPEGKIILKTLAEMKKEKLPAVNYEWDRLAQVIYFEMKNAHLKKIEPTTILIPLKVAESVFTKKNRIRLIPGNHSSPIGVVLKGDEMAYHAHKPYATALFKAGELFRFAISQLPDRPSWIKEGEEI